MKLLEYQNPKQEFHNKIESADLMRNEIIVAVIPKSLSCEICGDRVKHVWEDVNYMRDNGTFIRHCSACAVNLQRISKYPDTVLQEILNG